MIIENTLKMNTYKKNAFRQLEAGAYPRAFRKQVGKAIAGVATGKLRGVQMVKPDDRTNGFKVSIGYGERNTWFPNCYINQGEFVLFDTAEKVIAFLKDIQKAADDGEFDDALEDLRKERQEHARKMIEARNKCGFHRMHQHEGVSLLTTPSEIPMEPVSHGLTLQTEAL